MKYIAGVIYNGSVGDMELHQFKTFKEAEKWVQERLGIYDKTDIDESGWEWGDGFNKIKYYCVPYNQFFILKW